MPIEPFEERYLVRALSLLVNDDLVLRDFRDIIRPQYFEQPEVAWLVSHLVAHYDDKREACGVEHLRLELGREEHPRFSAELADGLLDRLETAPTGKVRNTVVDRLEGFLKRCALRQAIYRAAEYFDDGDEERAFDVIEDARTLRRASDDWRVIPPEDIDGFLTRHSSESLAETSVPVGMRPLDLAMNGGLRKGELGVWLAATGHGKSMALVHAGARAWLKGLNVVHFSFENSEDECETRYLANVSRIPTDELATEHEHIIKEKLAQFGDLVESKIYAKELPGSKTTIDDLSSYLERLEENGVEVGLVIVDYGDLMRSTARHEKKYDEQEAVFQELRDLAVIHGVPVWTATQTNRTALQNPWFDLSYIAESYAKAFKADIVLALCDGNEEQKNEFECDGFITIAKFRRGKTHWVIPYRQMFDMARLKDMFPSISDLTELPQIDTSKQRKKKAVGEDGEQQPERTNGAKKKGPRTSPLRERSESGD